MKKENKEVVEINKTDSIELENKEIDKSSSINNKKEKKETKEKIKLEDSIPAVELNKDDEILKSEKPKKKKKSFAEFLNLRKKKEKEPISEDAEKSRAYAWLAYILFFIPLIINGKNSFVRFHANEGLEINFIDAIGTILLLLGALIKPSTILTVLCVVIGIGLLTLTIITKIIMIFKALKGIKQESPWFFRWKIIK